MWDFVLQINWDFIIELKIISLVNIQRDLLSVSTKAGVSLI